MELDQCINFVLTKAQQSVYQLFKTELHSYGVTPGQYGILKCLWDKNGQTAKQLAEQLFLDSSTVTGILDRLENKGLVKRQPNSRDRRSLQVVLTNKGRELEGPLSQAIVRANQKALLKLEDDEIKQLQQLLGKLTPQE
ncbi:MAG: MarR family transcriptional regulator [Syntrophomonadaceae bacterium]|nr:MarR family transcriptional regulator [Syntrophomonadaceae bacterium]